MSTNPTDIIVLSSWQSKSINIEQIRALNFQESEFPPYVLTDFNSALGGEYSGAYGNVREDVIVLMNKQERTPDSIKLRRLDQECKTNYEITFDNLCENLCGQMSFYRATYLVIPYFAELLKQWNREGDLAWQAKGIMAAGSCLATDIYGDIPDRQVFENYNRAIQVIQALTICFLSKNMDYLSELSMAYRRELVSAVTAILGERKLAYILFISSWESCYLVCPKCEYCDEEIELRAGCSFDKIEKARVSSKKWDGKDLRDAKQWLFNLLRLLGDDEGEEHLCCYFGTYICPECGEKKLMLTGIENYYLGE